MSWNSMASMPSKPELSSSYSWSRDQPANGGSMHNGSSSGSSPRNLPTSRPGSAEVRPEFATAPNQWTMYHERQSGPSASQQLPGIHSILNDSQGQSDQGNNWKSSESQARESLARYNPSSNSHTALPTTAEAPMHYARSETRSDPATHARNGGQSHHQRSFSTSKRQSSGSVDLHGIESGSTVNVNGTSVNHGAAMTGRSASSSTIPHYAGPKESQGASYIYSDASMCRAGESGRPAKREWGVTKLGNPRKRQAEACIACRNKKIKCERVGPSRVCAHCTKQRIECQWARSSGPSPEPDEASQRTTDSIQGEAIAGSAHANHINHSPKERFNPTATKTSDVMDNTTLDEFKDDRLIKKPRLTSQRSSSAGHWQYQSSRLTPNSMMGDAHDAFEAGTDPFLTNPEISQRLLDLYFDYRDGHTATMFPRQAFTRWCYKCRSKSSADRMALYAILALGSVFSTSIELKGASQHLIDLAKQLEQREFSKFSIQLAQARLHITLYQWAKGFANHAFEYTDAGCRVLSALGYNTEDGCKIDVSDSAEENDYGLTATQLIECRRRTFWIGYMTERYNGYCSGHLGVFDNRDIWVALPNRESDFQSNIAVPGPLFNNGDCDLTGCGSHAFLAYMGSIWGDVTAEGYRSIYRPTLGYAKHYSSFYNETNSRIAAWEAALPEDLKFSVENTVRSIKTANFTPYYVIHALRFITTMKLNRFVRFEFLPTNVVRHNIRQARRSAQQLLELASTVAKSDGLPFQQIRSLDLENAVYQPFPAYAMLGACDILSARGSTTALSEAQSQLGHAKTVVSECAKFFNSAKQQKRMIDSRLGELGAHVAMMHSNRPTWKFPEPIEKSFIPKEMDLIYSVDDEVYYSAIEDASSQPGQRMDDESTSAAPHHVAIGLGLNQSAWQVPR